MEKVDLKGWVANKCRFVFGLITVIPVMIAAIRWEDTQPEDTLYGVCIVIGFPIWLALQAVARAKLVGKVEWFENELPRLEAVNKEGRLKQG